ncbi:hypothetical protein AAFF_G00390280 [Aldrovandia affinis]|uniref:Uncharacterized protein n=1 Tax=Aldrovandia affinis TaxID=143900 RepID=A0AAD7SEI0_9TELE|nr:hypothetical protein AAFF_G00390280 [Aldrovandia affinis]
MCHYSQAAQHLGHTSVTAVPTLSLSAVARPCWQSSRLSVLLLDVTLQTRPLRIAADLISLLNLGKAISVTSPLHHRKAPVSQSVRFRSAGARGERSTRPVRVPQKSPNELRGVKVQRAFVLAGRPHPHGWLLQPSLSAHICEELFIWP